MTVSTKEKDTLYLSKTDISPLVQFKVMLKKPVITRYWSITIQDKRDQIINITIGDGSKGAEHVFDILRSYYYSDSNSKNKHSALIYDLMYMNEAGKLVKLNKTIRLFP